MTTIPEGIPGAARPSEQTATRREIVGDVFRLLFRALHNPKGLGYVLVGLVAGITIATVGFIHYGWAKVWIPLYAADAEMATVAAAIYVVLVRWKEDV